MIKRLRQEKLREWIKAHDVSDAEIMMVLGLKSINQFQHRMRGVTPFTPLEKKVLSEYTGLPVEDFEVNT